MASKCAFALLVAQLAFGVAAQDFVLDSNFPHAYPGQPSGELRPEWQSYFLVDTALLPNVSFPLPRSFAGNVPVNRADHPNNTLFFWGFERSEGSLTDAQSAEPWILWLQGGPGSSSLAGLVLENGPLLLQPDSSMRPNNYSWDRLADIVWVDQPVGTGFSTSDATGYVPDNDQMAEDFIQFLTNFVKVFPALATRPVYITGESYAGHWIPYIAKALLSTDAPPVRLAKIAIGNGAYGSMATFLNVPLVTVIETFPELVSYDVEVLAYFREQHRLCGYDLPFTYPQVGGHFPTLLIPRATNAASPFFFIGDPAPPSLARRTKRRAVLLNRYLRDPSTWRIDDSGARVDKRRVREREERRRAWKRDLSLRSNGTVDPWYGCNLLDELVEYAVNYTFPWTAGYASLNIYDAPDALFPKPGNNVAGDVDGSFFNDNRTRNALHAPQSKDWVVSIPYPFINTIETGDPSPDPQVFFNDLAKNASDKGVGIVLYSGNNDMLVAHRSTELLIQNTTFGGTQGFVRKPGTPFFDDDGNLAGIVHQERGWTYALFQDAGHLVPTSKPAAAYAFLRDFILGNSTLGLVHTSPSATSIEGGVSAPLTRDFLPPATPAVFYGSGTTQGTVTYPAETVAKWNSEVERLYAATALPDADAGVSQGDSQNSSSVGRILRPYYAVLVGAVVCFVVGNV